MKIEVEEKICIRLGQYAAESGLESFSAAIGRLLSGQQDAPKPGFGSASSQTASLRSFASDIKGRYQAFVKRRVKTPGPVAGYSSALDYLAQTHNVNVWRMTSIEEVRQVYQRFRPGSDLREVNYRYHNGRMSAAVRQYIAFLQSENSG